MIRPEILLHGPRGRRLLLAFALASGRLADSDGDDYRLDRTVANASYRLDPGRGRSRVRINLETGSAARPDSTPADVANLLADVRLAEVTDRSIRHALVESVGSAMYWQEPDGEDALAAIPLVREALERAAEHIANSPLTDWWHSKPDLEDQWFVQFRHPNGEFPEGITLENLGDWRAQQVAAEGRALRERPSDPTANYSANWWSIPPITWWHSMRSLEDGSPAGLWLAEDAGLPEQAQVRQLHVPAGIRIYEIDGSDAWAELCRLYPLEQSAQKRHDWYRTTGRVDKWVMPDWSRVAEVYDGVHLTVAGYLAGAGIAIPVSEDKASVIAGWNPDTTWWFVDGIEAGQPVTWERDTYMYDSVWVQSL